MELRSQTALTMLCRSAPSEPWPMRSLSNVNCSQSLATGRDSWRSFSTVRWSKLRSLQSCGSEIQTGLNHLNPKKVRCFRESCEGDDYDSDDVACGELWPQSAGCARG